MKWLYKSSPTASEWSQGVCSGGWVQPSHLSSVKGLTEQWFSPDDPSWLRPFGILAGCACQALTAQEACYNNTYVSTRAEIEWQYCRTLTNIETRLVLGNSAKMATADGVVPECHVVSSYSRSIKCVIAFCWHFLHSSWHSMGPVVSWAILHE